MNVAFWRSKRVLITGHTGFKGSWLSLWLQSVGAEVVGYALGPPTEPNLFTTAKVADAMISVLGDVLNRDHLQNTIEKYRPEFVFHLAAQSLVRQSYKNPVDTYATNVMGLVHLLEGVRVVGGVRAVVCVTSDKCYENRNWVWGYREYESMGGYDPYSSSKGCSELVAAGYLNSFFNKNKYSEHGVALATARAGNVIGGGDWAKDRLIPDVVQSLMTGQDIILRNPHAIRPWQHVLDPLNGYLMLAEGLYEDGPAYSEGWNFAPADSQPVFQVVDQLLSLWGLHLSVKQDESDQPHEDAYVMLDSTKARVKLGWSPVLDLRTSLGWIVEWVKSYQTAANMRRVSEAQIQRYMEITQNNGIPDSQTTDMLPGAGLLDLVHETIIIRDTKGKIRYWNRGANDMYGWKSEEAIGHVSHELLQTKFPKSLNDIERELAGKGRWEGQLVHSTRNGKKLMVKSRWILKRGDDEHEDKVFEMNQICQP
jgi:CDP-glucose 4,6-dehydratase